MVWTISLRWRGGGLGRRGASVSVGAYRSGDCAQKHVSEASSDFEQDVALLVGEVIEMLRIPKASNPRCNRNNAKWQQNTRLTLPFLQCVCQMFPAVFPILPRPNYIIKEGFAVKTRT